MLTRAPELTDSGHEKRLGRPLPLHSSLKFYLKKIAACLEGTVLLSVTVLFKLRDMNAKKGMAPFSWLCCTSAGQTEDRCGTDGGASLQQAEEGRRAPRWPFPG